MKKTIIAVLAALTLVIASSALQAAVTSAQLLEKVKKAEAKFSDVQADMVMSEVNKKNVKNFDTGYGILLSLTKAKMAYKKPGMFYATGLLDGIKFKSVQNGKVRKDSGAGINKKTDVANNPGKGTDCLDLGFLCSSLWTDNTVTIVSQNGNVAEVKFVSKKEKAGSKRKELVWIDVTNLAISKKEHYSSDGTLKTRTTFAEHKALVPGLPIGSKATVFGKNNAKLGVITYANMKVNTGLKAEMFAIK